MNHLPRLFACAASAALSVSLAAQVTATNTVVGTGCIAHPASFYEMFATSAAFDLANSTLTMIPSAGGYFVLAGTTTFLAPSAAATTLSLGDDAVATVTLSAPFGYPGGSTSSLVVCSNGYVSVATNGNAWTPVPSAFLAAANTGWWAWHDYDPSLAAGGRVKFEQVGSKACITWDGVYDYQGATSANASTFQFQFDTASGMVHIVFQSMSALGNGRLIGYSPAGPSLDPGSVDLSAVLPLSFSVPGVDGLPLTLAASTRPLLGGTWTQTVSEVPANAVLGVDILGTSDPAVSDLTFLGLPGCGLRASLDVLSTWGPLGSTHTFSIGLPANPAWLGLHLYTTAAVFVPGINAYGAITANGIDGLLGNQ